MSDSSNCARARLISSCMKRKRLLEHSITSLLRLLLDLWSTFVLVIKVARGAALTPLRCPPGLLNNIHYPTEATIWFSPVLGPDYLSNITHVFAHHMYRPAAEIERAIDTMGDSMCFFPQKRLFTYVVNGV